MTKMLSPARLLPATGCALLCLMLVLGYARAQTSTPAAPTIDSVTPGDTQLKVAWSAPAGETGITAYDVRHIETSEDETDDTKWTVVDDAWTSVVLEYTITGLDNGIQYDVQVRAVNSNGDGTWSGTEIGTPALPAPAISSVRADDRAALVSWGEPTGIATGISAYDVRYIETSADESVDSNWTVEEDAWEDGGGSLTYAITGLTNDTGYDVQVRAVDENDVNGAWSTTSSATPEDHGNTRADATSITTDARIWGAFDPTNDEDYFRFSVSGTADFWIYTLGDLDTVGELLDSSGNPIASDDYGAVLPNPDNFFLWRKLQSGTYYIKVTGFGSIDEPYVLRIRQFTDTTSRSNAATLSINSFASGTIDPEEDSDYFKLVLSETTEVVIRASGFPDTVGELQRSNGTVIASNDDGYLAGSRRNFLIRESLRAGTYYVKVSSFYERSDGPYTVYATAITEPGSTIADAQVLPLGDTAGGIIDPAGDEDYFSLTLDETTYVIIGGVSQVIDISGELLDSNNLRAPVDSIHFGDVFIFQGRLDAGTYHLKVAGKDGTETGRYTVRAIREGSYTYFINRCSSISRSSGINDPLYGCQWHLNNDDQFRNSAGQDIRVEEVWPTYTGDGINVAVVDDGMHYRHEDLTDNVLTSFNHNYDPDQTDIYNYFEDHGTAVAGLIAAKDNSLGVRGVAPDAKIYGYNYLVEQSDANEADAMSRNSATTAISNNSWGPGDYGRPQHTHELWEAAVKDGVTNGYGGKGVVYVWAAGNGADDDDHSNLDEFANFYAVTAVCAVGHDDKRSSYSETGSNLWVCGPSNSRRVGQPRIATTDNGNRYRGSFGGTSAATPIVSGVVALVREANSSLTWRDVKLIMAASARKSDPDNTGWVEGAFKYGSTTDRYNYNHEYGFGMVDAKAAVDLAAGWTNAPELREITSESRAINLRIPDLPSSGTPTTVTTSLNVDPYVEFVEFVEVNAHFNHSNFRDLTVELVSPSGTVSTLSNSAPIGGALTTEFRFGSARHLGEDPAGEWTLRVKDVLRRDSGRLQSWGLTVYGHGSIPGAPDIDTVTPGGGTLSIDWKEPTVTGATAITSYDLRYIRDDATDKSDDNWTPLTDVGTGNLSHTITGLEGGVKYEFQLRAHNDSGHGPWSQAEADEPTTVAPSAPSITSITRGDRTLAIVWTAPADTGGGGITAYDVRYIETSADETVESNWTVRDNAWRSGDLGYVVRNLTNTTEYDVQVRAVNRAGDGHWSETKMGTPLPDDIPIHMQWDDTTPDVDEDAGSVVLRAVFTTTLDAPPAADFEFDLVIATTALRATQDDDYTPPPSSANFVASDFSQTVVNGQQRYRATRDFIAVIIDDTEDESTEDFRVTMNYLTPGLAHLQGGPQSATVTIRDNEHVPVTISWDQSDITVDEDDGSVTLRAFAVTTVDKRPEDGFSFDTSIYTSNGSAAQPGDYTQLDDTITFSRNDFSRVTVNGNRRYRAAKQIVVNIEDDTIDEIEEDFTVTFEYSNSTLPHLQGGPAIASVKIADNDYVPVTISWEQADMSVSEDAGSVTLYARSTTTEAGMPLSDFSFDARVTTRSGSAQQNSDYTSWDATETFLHSDFSPTSVNGELRYRAEKQITIDILDDIHNEGDEVFTVRLAYSNPSLPYLQGSSATATITITDDERVDPTISTRNPPSTYRENGTSTVYTFRATDPQGGPITWSLEGDDRGDFIFTMDSSGQRVLAFSTPPDFENPSDADRQNDYELTVIATDEDNQADRLSFTVTVTDLNEGPEISRVGSAPGSVPENYDSSLVLARYTATDPENPTAQITQWSTSGTDGGDFIINDQGELRFRNTPDYERPADSNRDNVYVFTVRASDGRVYGTFDETITVTPVNEPPTITTTSSSATALRQNENVTSRLYTYRATDQEGSTVTWSVGGVDGRFFTIDERGQFSFKEDNPPDYEIPGDSGGNNVYDVTIQARDDEFNNASLPVTVMVREVNEGPEISRVGSAPGSVPENQEQMQVLARYTATDPEEGTVLRWRTSGTDGGDFVISEQGELRFRYTPDYERPADSNRDNVYVFTVQVSDGRYYGTFEETVTVTPVNEPPIITTTSSSATELRQNENQTSRLYTYRATDPEGSTVTWSVGGTDERFFAIDERGQFSFSESSPPDFEQPGDSGRDNVYDVTVQVRDDGFNTASLPVKVTVREVNEGPEVTSGQSAFTISENQDLPNAVYTGFDPEGGTVTRWNVGGRDGGDFAITQEGLLAFRNLPDYERPADSNRDNTYELQVRPYDGRYYGSFDVTVTVTPVNEPPTITTTSSSATVLRQNENQTPRLYTYRATDPEQGTITWLVGGTDGRYFAIDERGQFSFSESSPPDFEQPGDSGRDNVYDVTIQARDDGGNTASLPVTVTVREVNEGPEVTSGQSAFTISENQDLPNAVYSGFDPEGGTVTRWTVGGRDGGDFKISQEGTLTFRNTPDYERPADSNRDNIYELQVRPYDGRYYGSFDVTVTVNDVNEPPTITTTSSSATALQQKENQTSRLYTYRATDPEGSTVTWSVGGVDERFFAIDVGGQFSFRKTSPPDFEQPVDSGGDNLYDATIQARDDGFNTASLPVTVTVANDAEGVEPTIGTRRPPSTYRENGTSAVYTFRASDPQRQSITWTLEGDDRRDFTITGDSSGRGVLAFSVPPDFEDPSDSDRQNDYELTVIATDEDGHSDRLSFTITVTDVNEGPEVSGPSAFTIAENQGLSNAVYSATDPEGANVARWSVGGRDGGDFSITQGGTLYFRNLPDYERPADSNRDNVYEVSIQPSDGRNTGSYPVTVTVTDVNEAPEFRSGSTTSFTQPENRTSRLYTFSAIDPEQGTITWSVGGTDGNHFTIDERGQFSFKEDSPPDFDTPGDDGRDNLYNITIEARDPESNTASLQVTVRVTEVNEGPVITRQGSAPGSVPENHGVNEVLARYTASDPERPTVRITGWSTASTDGGDFVMNALGELRFRNSPDFERPADSNRDNVYEVTIRASDGRNTGTLEEVQVVTVTDVNEPPTITTTSRTTFSQPENRTSTLYTFRATDPEGGTVTWTTAGTDGRFFAIDEQGRFSFREDSPPDFDAAGDAGGNNEYNVTVQARDPEFNSSSLDVVVTVTDHNENVEPTISTRRPPSTYRENGTSTIYTFRASDPQPGTTITWSLTGTDGGAFTITRDSSGRGVLAFASPPDFESPADADRDNVYELAVVATDDDGNTDRVDFSITVTNHNEGVEPTISTRRPPSTYRENNTSAVYTFRASDPQRETTIRWSVTGTDAGSFIITPDSRGRGVLTFNSVPDFESPADSDQDNAYELAVVAADGDGNSDRVDFTITVTDVNEPPVVTLNGTATTTVPENTSDTQVLARFTARDPENPSAGIYRWSTSGRDGGDFVISELGELRFRASPDYERPADSDRDNVYEVTVRASDGSSYGMPENTLTITVSQMNEPPVITTKSRTEFSLRENSTSTIYTYRATDQDDSDTIRWSVEGADGGDFAIYTGVLTFRLLPDLENPVDSDEDNVYEITVVASDQAGLRDTVNATITITEQPEGPVIAGRTSFTVAENYDITQVLGSYTATDAKDGRTVHPQWSLSGRDGGDFVIDRSSGTLTFRNTPDYDRPADSNRDNVYEVTVRGHDSRAYGNLNVKVTVTNINEEAPVVTGRNSHTVRENTTSAIYTYRATDSDLNDTIVWSTGGADGHLFQVSDRGELSFREAPDFETPRDAGQDNAYALDVVATDGEGLRGTLSVTVTVTELNEGPVVSGTPTFTVNENQDLSGATYTASDPEAIAGVTTTITWSTAGRDGGDFIIDRETGVLTFRSLPDYERPADSNRDNEYEVTVRAYDGRNYGTFDVTVTVLAVNEGPEITGRDTFSYRENGTSALYTYRATDPEGDEFTWGLGGLDASNFEISDRGVLTFASPPNFDSPAGSGTDGNEYLVTVQARDDQGNTGELPVTVTVTDQNEGARMSGRTEIAVEENLDPTLVLASYSASDPEGQAITRWSLGGSDSGDFNIDEFGDLTFRNVPDYDRPADSNRDNEYRVTVRAYDGSAYGNLDVTITVSNQNEHYPVIRSGSGTSFNYREESTSALYTYSATDQDKDDVITWTTAGADGHLFEFDDRNALTFREPPDYEDPRDAGRDNQYELAVVATDSGGLSDRLDVTVAVTAVDEGPEITGTATYTVAESQELTGATFTARDPEDPTIDVTNWRTSGTDGGDFTISQDGELSFRSTPDYERPADSNRDNVYLVTVQASDGRNYGSLDVTVTVTDQNESNPVVSGRDTLSSRENTTSTLYTYSARDMDRDAEIMWSVRGTDSGDFTIGEKGELSFSSSPNHEQPADSDSDNVYEITVVASDGQNEGTLDVTVTVTEVNEGPEISGTTFITVSENHEAVLATYTGRDPEDAIAEITRWSVTGRDGGDFTINEDGELTFRNPPDYERPADSNRDNEYEVTVRASDGKVYGIYEVTVTVEAVDEAPEFQRSSRNSFSYRENGTSDHYTYRATDPEGAEVAWSVSGTDGRDFAMSASGVLSFREPPDYDDPADDDENNEYEVTVVATDQTGHAANLTVTVTVTDVNEGPIISGAGEFTVRENYDALLGTYTARDPEDPTIEVTNWRTSGTDGGDFTMSQDGELSFRSTPDYERPADSNRDNVYLLTVQVSDGRNFGSFDVTVTVEAVNEAPDITGDEAISYQENSDRDLETYRATDPEKTDITWGLSGADSGAFAISETGVLTFLNAPDYESPTDSGNDNVYEVTVEATDEDGETGRMEVTVTVTNVTD